MKNVAIVLPNYIDGKLGGTQTFVDNLILALSNDSNLRLEIFLPKGQVIGGVSQDKIVNFFHKPIPFFGAIFNVIKTGSPKFQQRLLDFDVAYFPLQAARSIKTLKVTSVVTIHDVQHLDLPTLFSRLTRYYRKRFYDRQAKYFSYICTISEFSRNRIIEQLDLNGRDVFVHHSGIENVGNRKKCKRQNFILYPANSWPHKNHLRLFEAFGNFAGESDLIKLFLTGDPPSIPIHLRKVIFDLGRVEKEQLFELYRSARGLVFPSFYEGFGFPPLEAMSAGCPTAVSTSGSLPEICEEASIYFNPFSVKEIEQALRELCRSGNSITEAGLRQAGKYQWGFTATKYSNLFQSIE